MKLIVKDRYSIERGILVRSAYVVISIHDPDKQRARIPKQSGLRGVLYLAFHDAEPSERLALPEDIVLMTEDQARQVWEFVRQWEGQVGSVVVHCEQGMSRSPAVAAAIFQAFGGDPQDFFREYQPNQYVYRLMNEVNARGLAGDAGPGPVR
jgi:predicted protein tyrosine phosphatase